MITVTLQTTGTLKPEMSVHGDIVKLDMGALLIEADRVAFREFIKHILSRAAEHEMYFLPLI